MKASNMSKEQNRQNRYHGGGIPKGLKDAQKLIKTYK